VTKLYRNMVAPIICKEFFS